MKSYFLAIIMNEKKHATYFVICLFIKEKKLEVSLENFTGYHKG